MPTYKDEKTGLWYCKFVYTDWTGTKKQKKKKGFRLQKEAKQYELDFLSKTSNSCDMLFSDMVEIYMDDCKARIRPTTYKGKEDIIAVHIMPYFKNLKINEIQPMNVRRWQTELMNNQRNYKPTYLRTLNSQLSAIFNFAVKYYGLSSNPVQKAELSVKRIPDWNRSGQRTNSSFLLMPSVISCSPRSSLICFTGQECDPEKCWL